MTTTGKAFWRTLDELADEPSFRERLYNEFPTEVEAISDPTTRRTFLKLMGASLALAGAGACTRQPLEKIVPYVRQPEEIIPGRPLYYATAMTVGGVSSGLLVETHEGRPTKIEGNPDHPDNLGATDVFAQAAILDLYDPDRARAVLAAGENADEVRAAERFFVEAGIRGVPAIVIERRHLVSGGQPPEVFERALREIAAAKRGAG